MRNQSATGVLREPENLLFGGDADVSTTREDCKCLDKGSMWTGEAQRGVARAGLLREWGSLSWTLKNKQGISR